MGAEGGRGDDEDCLIFSEKFSGLADAQRCLAHDREVPGSPAFKDGIDRADRVANLAEPAKRDPASFRVPVGAGGECFHRLLLNRDPFTGEFTSLAGLVSHA